MEGTAGKKREAMVGLIDTETVKGPIGSLPKVISEEKLRVPGKYLVEMLR